VAVAYIGIGVFKLGAKPKRPVIAAGKKLMSHSQTNSSFMQMLRQAVWPMMQKVWRQETQEIWIEAITVLVYPLTFLLAFGLGLQSSLKLVAGYPYPVFLMPGLIAYTVLIESFSMAAWGFWLDRWFLGMLDEARIKPVSLTGLMLGQMFGVASMALVKGVLTALVLGCLLGYWPNPVNALLYALMLLPGSLAFVCIGSVVGLYFKKPDHIAQSLTILITPLLYLGGLFFPITQLPQGLQQVIRWLPTTVIFEGGRAAFLGEGFSVWALLGLWASISVVFSLTVLGLQRLLRKG
jgi:lipooligosaccharide transport system permease protein